MTRVLKGTMVAGLCVVRQARCQHGSASGAQCGAKTRLAIAIPVSDSEDLAAVRLCGQHVETAVEAIRGGA